jgi:hypothetical protein
MNNATRWIAAAFLFSGFLLNAGCQNMPGFKGNMKTAAGQSVESRRVMQSVNSTEVPVDESRNLVMLDMHDKDSGNVPMVVALTIPWQTKGKLDVSPDQSNGAHGWLIDPSSVGSQGQDWNQSFHDYLIRFTVLSDEQRSKQPGVTPVAGSITVQQRNVEPAADYDLAVNLHTEGGGSWIEGRFERASMYKHKWVLPVILAPYYVFDGDYQ